MGYTIVIDLTAAPACLLGGVLILALAARLGAAAFFKMACSLVLGGVLGLLPLLVYNQLAFGSPFTFGYSLVVGFEGMQEGFFGITWPKARRSQNFCSASIAACCRSLQFWCWSPSVCM